MHKCLMRMFNLIQQNMISHFAYLSIKLILNLQKLKIAIFKIH